jgi:hypothetical protein
MNLASLPLAGGLTLLQAHAWSVLWALINKLDAGCFKGALPLVHRRELWVTAARFEALHRLGRRARLFSEGVTGPSDERSSSAKLGFPERDYEEDEAWEDRVAETSDAVEEAIASCSSPASVAHAHNDHHQLQRLWKHSQLPKHDAALKRQRPARISPSGPICCHQLS